MPQSHLALSEVLLLHEHHDQRIEGDQKPWRGYWDALENLCKHYWEVDRQPKKVIEYARLRYLVTKGVKPYNMSKKSANHAKLAKAALGK